MAKKRRVLIIYTGGTFGMAPSARNPNLFVVPKLSPARLKRRFLDHVPELRKIAQCDVKVAFNRDSSNVGSDDWVGLAKLIQSQGARYHGIVLLHGTDTMSYSASALSLLVNLRCPVVMTGAQLPLATLRTDARQNLMNSVEIAARAPGKHNRQLMVFFDDRLFLGSKIRKKSATDYDAFESPRFPALAEIGSQIHYTDTYYSLKTKKPKMKLSHRFSKRVPVIQVTPDFPATSFGSSFYQSIDGLVVSVFPSGTSPIHQEDFREMLASLRRRKIPVVAVTERSGQPSDPATYAIAKKLVDAGAYWAGDMTPEHAYVRTSLILGQKSGSSLFARYWKSL